MAEESRSKSAIDVIYDLEEHILNIKKEISIISSNIKLLNNKTSKLQKIVAALEEERIVSAENTNVSASSADIIPKTGKKSTDWVGGKIKTFGRIASKRKQPIPGVQVVIYNEQGDSIKTRQTDSDGYWEVRLPPGKFGVEYTHKKFKPINLVIELPEDIDEFEVK